MKRQNWENALRRFQARKDERVAIRIGTPASTALLQQITQLHGAALPPDYRRFLYTVGALEIKVEGSVKAVWFGSAEEPSLQVVATSEAVMRSHPPHTDFAKVLAIGATRDGYDTQVLDEYTLLDNGKVITTSLASLGQDRAKFTTAHGIRNWQTFDDVATKRILEIEQHLIGPTAQKPAGRLRG